MSEDEKELKKGKVLENEDEQETGVGMSGLSEITEETEKERQENKKNKIILETDNVNLYTNLYPITFKRNIYIYEYPFEIKPECHEESVILKILRETSPKLFKNYGHYYRSGNSIFALEKVKKKKRFRTVIAYKNMIQYTLKVKPTRKKEEGLLKRGKLMIFQKFKKKFYL